MPPITRISETKRGRYALFGEGDEFLFSVDGETLVKHAIKEGSSLTEGELALLKEDSDTRKAKDAALRYLSLRAYGENELYQKLCRRFDPPSCAAAVALMRELALLDDTIFALEKAKGMAQRGKSSMEIRRKLQELGVDDADVANAMDSVETDDEATATRLVEKMYTEKLRRGETQKVLAALARRGFAYPVARAAIEAVTCDMEIEAEQKDWNEPL